MKLQDTKRSYYICKLLAEKEQEGINYLKIDSLFSLASSKAPNLLYEEFSKDLSIQQILGNVVIEDDICYIAFNRRHEIALALNITNYLEDNLLDSYKAPNPVNSLLFLTDEQSDAVKMALTCRLSIIAGAAGTGKTAMVKDLISCYKKEKEIILFSPAHEGVSFSKAKGYKLKPLYYLEESENCENFLIDTGWNNPGLIIVDNADMLSLGELCGILYNAPLDCHIVLLGDDSKVSSCAEECVFTDLIGLGIPAAHLTMQHRYALGSALEKKHYKLCKGA